MPLPPQHPSQRLPFSVWATECPPPRSDVSRLRPGVDRGRCRGRMACTAPPAMPGAACWRAGRGGRKQTRGKNSVVQKTEYLLSEFRLSAAASSALGLSHGARAAGRVADETAGLLSSSAVRVPHDPHGQCPRPIGPVRARFENGDQTLRRDCCVEDQPHGANRDSLGHAAARAPANEAVQPVHQAQGAAACCRCVHTGGCREALLGLPALHLGGVGFGRAVRFGRGGQWKSGGGGQPCSSVSGAPCVRSESGGLAPLQEEGGQLRLLDPVPQAEGPGVTDDAHALRYGHVSL